MNNINNTLEERQNQNGDYKKFAKLSQSLKKAFADNAVNYNNLTNEMKESVEMILHKLSRIGNGDSKHVDHWHDIAGYASLVEKSLDKLIYNNKHYTESFKVKNKEWVALTLLVAKLESRLVREYFKPTRILAIGRGGLVPATYIAHALDVSTIDTCRNSPPNYTEKEKILIVDDISDSGKTLAGLVRQIKCECVTATILKRYNTSYTPSYIGREVEHDNWITFPWEVK